MHNNYHFMMVNEYNIQKKINRGRNSNVNQQKLIELIVFMIDLLENVQQL